MSLHTPRERPIGLVSFAFEPFLTAARVCLLRDSTLRDTPSAHLGGASTYRRRRREGLQSPGESIIRGHLRCGLRLPESDLQVSCADSLLRPRPFVWLP